VRCVPALVAGRRGTHASEKLVGPSFVAARPLFSTLSWIDVSTPLTTLRTSASSSVSGSVACNAFFHPASPSIVPYGDAWLSVTLGAQIARDTFEEGADFEAPRQLTRRSRPGMMRTPQIGSGEVKFPCEGGSARPFPRAEPVRASLEHTLPRRPNILGVFGRTYPELFCRPQR